MVANERGGRLREVVVKGGSAIVSLLHPSDGRASELVIVRSLVFCRCDSCKELGRTRNNYNKFIQSIIFEFADPVFRFGELFLVALLVQNHKKID